MEETIKEIVDQFFKEKKLDKVKETEDALLKQFGKNFVNKNVKQITVKEEKVIIKTNTIEAKTEINLYKKTLIKEGKIIIK
ncbi:MAG: hypothetical protein CBB66_02080 [bacterium TMED6]|nr:MAG: hypothetical protein CBB66_02080 [bacterium TMED6]